MDKLLTLWGFPNLVAAFAEQEIDEEALLCLDISSLKELIPKIGPRTKFFAKLKEYQNVMNMSILIPGTSNQGDASNFIEKPSEIPHSFIASASSSTELFEDDMLSPASPSTSSDVSESRIELATAFDGATKRKIAFIGLPMMKKACRNVYNLDLRQFLDKTVTGRFILNTYSKELRFSRKMRSQLSGLLVSGLMSENKEEHFIPLDFEILSEKICELFPTETRSTYYIPRMPATKTTKPVNPRGKLIDKYRNLKRLYNLPKDDNEDILGREKSNLLNNPSDIDELNKCAQWLQIYQEPWDLVIQNWKKTFPLRKVTNNSPTVEEYMKQWPILKHRDAYTLIQFDFQQLQPNCQIKSLLSEYQKWQEFFDRVKAISNVDKTTEEFTSPLNADISQDSKNAIQAASLPMLIPPKVRIRLKKTHWKPSIAECQESLINLVSTCGNIDELIVARRQKLSELNLTVQPYLVVVGTSFSSVTECYLVIDNNIYQTCSVLQGLDFAFKAFHALNANYPKESEHIWLLIERILYNIETSNIKIPAVLTILKDLENI